MKITALLVLLGAAVGTFFYMAPAPTSGLENKFIDFLETHRVSYGTTEEYNYRMGVFEQNLEHISDLNRRNPYATFEVNQWGDRTPQEQEAMLGHPLTLEEIEAADDTNVVDSSMVGDMKPSSVDWTHLWDDVENTGGDCQSSWAFATVRTVEGRWKVKNHHEPQILHLSEQEVIDCTTQSYSDCGSYRTTSSAYSWLQKDKGLCTRDAYPYEAGKKTCRYTDNDCSGGIHINRYIRIREKDTEAHLNSLHDGPITLWFDSRELIYYTGGVITDCGSKPKTDHGGVLVGYYSNDNTIKVRLSWGETWGEKGYIRISLNEDNLCGWNLWSHYPTF